jgi:hypothetical protein
MFSKKFKYLDMQKKFYNKLPKFKQGTYVKVKGLKKLFFLIRRWDDENNEEISWLSKDGDKEITIRESEIENQA